MVDNGEEYFCSKKCLEKTYTWIEWCNMVKEDENSFWTTWESQDEFFYDENGVEVD